MEAVSTEKKVRVRVKLYDDKTDIYSQDIDMSTGEGGFIVPTVMADAPFVNLQVSMIIKSKWYKFIKKTCLALSSKNEKDSILNSYMYIVGG